MKKENKYMVINIEVRDGDNEYSSIDVFSIDADMDVEKYAEEYAQTFFGSEDTIEEREESNGWYWDDFFVRMCRLYSSSEISKEEYEILRKYV